MNNSINNDYSNKNLVISCGLIIVIIVVVCFACFYQYKDDGNDDNEVDDLYDNTYDIVVDDKNEKYYVGKEYKIDYYILQNNEVYDDKATIEISNNKMIKMLDDNKFLIINSGNCILTIKYKNISKEIIINAVNKPSEKEIAFSKEVYDAYVGEEVKLSLDNYDMNNIEKLVFTANNKNVSINKNVIKCLKFGTTIVSINIDGKEYFCTINIKKKNDSITIEPVVANYTGKPIPANNGTCLSQTNLIYSYYVNDNCNGIPLSEVPIKAGIYSVLVKSSGNDYYNSTSKCITHTIKEIKESIKDESSKIEEIESIKLNTSKVELNKGKTYDLKVVFGPSTITGGNIKWTSSNEKVVKVNNGHLTAINYGLSTIKATTDNNKIATCEVIVYPEGSYINFKSTYSLYKTNILLYRTKSVMQSFAIDDGYMYITQQANENGASLSKIPLDSISNDDFNIPTLKKFSGTTALLKDYGHLGQIDIEKTNGAKYLWAPCGSNDEYICRINMDKISFGSPPVTNNNNSELKIKGDVLNFVSIDNENRLLTVKTGHSYTQNYKTYLLDDYVNKRGNVKPIFEFDINIKNMKANTDLLSKQGFVVKGNYIYIYEGNTSTNTVNNKGAYISVWTLQGENIIYRRLIPFPNYDYIWEPEGIKIYNNKIYIGIRREIISGSNSGKKTANILVLK